MSETRTVLITGASAGIGEAIAREYAQRGWNLALTARREEPMVALAKALKTEFRTISHIFPLDLSEADAVTDLLARIDNKGLRIDGLVNNAGLGLPGHYIDQPWEEHEKMLQLMLRAPCELCRALLPSMVENNFGRIINVASLAGHIPGSRGHTLYAGIKSFLIKFSQSLNLEMDGTNVNVSALCPGFTYSEFHDVNGTRDAVSKLPSAMWMSAQEVAEQGVEAAERDRAVFIPGRVNKSIATIVKYMPSDWAFKLMGAQSERIRKGR